MRAGGARAGADGERARRVVCAPHSRFAFGGGPRPSLLIYSSARLGLQGTLTIACAASHGRDKEAGSAPSVGSSEWRRPASVLLFFAGAVLTALLPLARSCLRPCSEARGRACQRGKWLDLGAR